MESITKNPLEINRDKIKRNLLNSLKFDFMESQVYN